MPQGTAMTDKGIHRVVVVGGLSAAQHGSDFGAHGVWGGLVEGERQGLRRRWLTGTTVAEFLREELAAVSTRGKYP